MIIGLTGGIASGKTTACLILESLNIPIIDADLIARQITLPNHPVLFELSNAFGNDILNEGVLNRQLLRQRAFSSTELTSKLNSITHPAIHQIILKSLKSTHSDSYKVLCAPLLFENKLAVLCDQTWLIDVAQHTQIERIMVRDQCDRKTAENIINAQLSSTKKRELADIVIPNSNSTESFKQSILTLHQSVLEKLHNEQNKRHR